MAQAKTARGSLPHHGPVHGYRRSTRLRNALGDRAWRDLVEQHHELIRRQLRRFGGREVDTAGRRLLRSLRRSSSSRRLRADDRRPAAELGLQVGGFQTGEVEEAGGVVRGIAVHIGSRIGGDGWSRARYSCRRRFATWSPAPPWPSRIAGSTSSRAWPASGTSMPASRAPRFADEFGAGGDAAVGKWPRSGAAWLSARDGAGWRSRPWRWHVRRFWQARIYVVTRASASLPAVAANAVGVIDAASGRSAEVPVGGRPDGIAFGEGALWVANHADGTVSRIDPVKPIVVQTIEVGDGPVAWPSASGRSGSPTPKIERFRESTRPPTGSFSRSTIGSGPTRSRDRSRSGVGDEPRSTARWPYRPSPTRSRHLRGRWLSWWHRGDETAVWVANYRPRRQLLASIQSPGAPSARSPLATARGPWPS